ncbi:MAG TPA: hypothetical protein V6C81_13155 [Planktothrix sp.]
MNVANSDFARQTALAFVKQAFLQNYLSCPFRDRFESIIDSDSHAEGGKLISLIAKRQPQILQSAIDSFNEEQEVENNWLWQAKVENGRIVFVRDPVKCAGSSCSCC